MIIMSFFHDYEECHKFYIITLCQMIGFFLCATKGALERGLTVLSVSFALIKCHLWMLTTTEGFNILSNDISSHIPR